MKNGKRKNKYTMKYIKKNKDIEKEKYLYTKIINFNSIKFLKILILICFINPIYNDNYISLKLEGTGEQQIINSIYSSKINIEVDGVTKATNDNKFTVSGDENTIKIICNEQFTNCDSIFENFPNIIELDFTYFDSSQVTSMRSMFLNSNNIKKITFPNNFDTSKVTCMHHMFAGCILLESLDLSSFNTEEVTNMDYMFYKCQSLQELELSHFNMAKVTNMTYMFSDCFALKSLNLNNWNTEGCQHMEKIFQNCISLKSLNFISKLYFFKIIEFKSF